MSPHNKRHLKLLKIVQLYKVPFFKEHKDAQLLILNNNCYKRVLLYANTWNRIDIIQYFVDWSKHKTYDIEIIAIREGKLYENTIQCN